MSGRAESAPACQWPFEWRDQVAIWNVLVFDVAAASPRPAGRAGDNRQTPPATAARRRSVSPSTLRSVQPKGVAGEVNEIRSQQRTSSGFDSDADPRLAIRRVALVAQRSSDVDDVAGDSDQTTTEADLSNGSRELESIGTGGRDSS